MCIRNDFLLCGSSAFVELQRSLDIFSATIRASIDHGVRSVTVLVDTGAQRSCISMRLLKKLQNKSAHRFPRRATEVHMHSAAGEDIPLEGIVTVPVRVADTFCISAELLIGTNLAYDRILGLDVLLATRARIDLDALSVTFSSPDPLQDAIEVPFHSYGRPIDTLRLTQDVVIQAGQQVRVPVFTTNRTHLGHSALLQSRPTTYMSLGVHVAAAMIDNVEQMQLYSFIYNPGRKTISLSKHSRVAQLAATGTTHVTSHGHISYVNASAMLSLTKHRTVADANLTMMFTLLAKLCDRSESRFGRSTNG